MSSKVEFVLEKLEAIAVMILAPMFLIVAFTLSLTIETFKLLMLGLLFTFNIDKSDIKLRIQVDRILNILDSLI